MVIAFGHHPHGDPVPLLQSARGGFLAHCDGCGIRQQVAQHHRCARLDIADFVQTDWRIPQRGEIGPVQGRFLPAAPFQVEIDDVAVLIVLAKEILEPAAPEDT